MTGDGQDPKDAFTGPSVDAWPAVKPVNLRNLEEIKEVDDAPRASRLGALVLASLATAAIVTATFVANRGDGAPAISKVDPLAALVASARNEAPVERIDGSELKFPAVLSDAEEPTTALAAVKDERGRLVPQTSSAEPPGPPPAADRLPVVPLPVGNLLGATPVTTEPKDPLTALAANASKVPEGAALAPPGSQGGYELQVASFKTQQEAEALVEDLRRRGHRAYRQAAYVPNRGLWHRVRIGPFDSRGEALRYKTQFEQNERLTPFLIDPAKVKRAEEIRRQKLREEERRRRGAKAVVRLVD
ncbi:MAG: SPOR domain-containing protein [Pseudomonadota bacterium]